MRKLFHSFFLSTLFLVSFRCGACYADRQNVGPEPNSVPTALFQYYEQGNENPTLENDLRQAVSWPMAEEYLREKLPFVREVIQNYFSDGGVPGNKVLTDASDCISGFMERLKQAGVEIQNQFIRKQGLFFRHFL